MTDKQLMLLLRVLLLQSSQLNAIYEATRNRLDRADKHTIETNQIANELKESFSKHFKDEDKP